MSTETLRSGTELGAPPAGRWVVDTAHSSIEATARHIVVAKVRGTFREFDATIDVGEDPTDSTVTVEIAAASIDTRDTDRDAHLRSPDFLDVETFPSLRFVSTSIAHIAGDRWQMDGDLTIRDVTRPVSLDLTYAGVTTDPWGQDKAVFEAATQIDRTEFGMTWNQALEAGGVLVGPKLRIEIMLQAVRA